MVVQRDGLSEAGPLERALTEKRAIRSRVPWWTGPCHERETEQRNHSRNWTDDLSHAL